MEDNERINGFYVFELKDGLWEMAAGRTKHFSEVTHQHWSNIYWYHSYLVDKVTKQVEQYNRDSSSVDSSFDDVVKDIIYQKQQFIAKALSSANFALAQLSYRFEGKILEWQPIYENEKAWYAEECTRKILIEKI